MRRHRALRQNPGLVWLQTTTTGDYVPALHVRCPGGERAVRFRSSSRVGYGDMGVNRARMERVAAEWVKGA